MSSSFMMVFGLVPLKVRHDASYDENPPHAFLEALTTLVLLLLPLCARVTGAGAALLRLQGGWPRPRPRRGQEHPVCRPCRARAPSAAYRPGRGAPVWPRSSAAPSSPRRCAAAACGVPQQLAPVIERRARTLAGARYPGPVCVRQVCRCVGVPTARGCSRHQLFGLVSKAGREKLPHDINYQACTLKGHPLLSALSRPARARARAHAHRDRARRSPWCGRGWCPRAAAPGIRTPPSIGSPRAGTRTRRRATEGSSG